MRLQSLGTPLHNAAQENRASTTILTWDPAKPAAQETWLSRGGDGRSGICRGAAGEQGGHRLAFPGCHHHGYAGVTWRRKQK